MSNDNSSGPASNSLSADSGFLSMEPDDLGGLILATGALGLASFGIVDVLKSIERIGLAGIGKIKKCIKDSSMENALEQAYGKEYEDLLKAQYRENRTKGDLRQIIRQGLRVGLHEKNTKNMAKCLGGVFDSTRLEAIAKKLAGSNQKLGEEEIRVLSR